MKQNIFENNIPEKIPTWYWLVGLPMILISVVAVMLPLLIPLLIVILLIRLF
jgi:hypothetical protein